jgi:hypothetical protein
MMQTKEDEVKELFDRYCNITQEIKLLQEDRKNLLAEFKEKISPSVFKSALKAVQIQAKLKPNEVSQFEAATKVISDSLSIEFID